jgi:hypothetical protein
VHVTASKVRSGNGSCCAEAVWNVTQVATVIGAAGVVDHLVSGVHSVDRHPGTTPVGQVEGKPSGARGEGRLSWLELEPVGHSGFPLAASSPPEPHPQITDTGLANQRVLILVISFLRDSPSVGMIRNLFLY